MVPHAGAWAALARWLRAPMSALERNIMKILIGAAAVLTLLASAPVAAQTAAATKSTSHVTTSNGKVTSATTTTQKAACRNDKGQFIKCAQVTNTSTMAKVAKGADGKCRYSTGPKKGQFAKCP